MKVPFFKNQPEVSISQILAVSRIVKITKIQHEKVCIKKVSGGEGEGEGEGITLRSKDVSKEGRANRVIKTRPEI